MKKLSMSGKSIKLQVTVTNDDIARGVRGNVSRCPIALALGDNAGTLTGYPIVGVCSLNVTVRHPVNHHLVRLYAPLPNKAIVFVKRFDEQFAVKPFKFTVTFPPEKQKPQPRKRAGV